MEKSKQGSKEESLLQMDSLGRPFWGREIWAEIWMIKSTGYTIILVLAVKNLSANTGDVRDEGSIPG